MTYFTDEEFEQSKSEIYSYSVWEEDFFKVNGKQRQSKEMKHNRMFLIAIGRHDYEIQGFHPDFTFLFSVFIIHFTVTRN